MKNDAVDPSLPLVCMRCVYLPRPPIASQVEKCSRCAAFVWKALSSPKQNVIWCMECAHDEFEEDDVQVVITDDQLTDIVNHFVGVEMVLEINAEAVKRGALSIWTVYNNPDGYMARRHEVLEGKERATLDTMKADLGGLQEVFREAGLIRMERSPEDDPVIVEAWI